MIDLTLHQRPIPLKRTRISGSHVYDSQKREKLLAYLELKKQWGHQAMFMDSIHVDLLFVFPVCDSWSALKQRKYRNNPHIGKIDIDNLVKYILDVLIGIAFADDCIVASLSARKVYGDETRTEISIKRI